MDRGRVGKDRGSKETDGYPLTGLRNTIGEETGRPGRGSSKILGIRSLRSISEQSISLIRKEDSHHRTTPDLAQCPPGKDDQTH
jgi:hypothetical protein